MDRFAQRVGHFNRSRLPGLAGAKKQFVNFGTASIGGSYYPTGGWAFLVDICASNP